MKKVALGLILLIPVLLGLASLAGLPPNYLIYGPGVASGIGSKLLCSAEYVMGNSRQQAIDDLIQYSPILSQVRVDYDDDRQAVSTSLFGIGGKTAFYLPGFGCAVDYPAFQQRRSLVVQSVASSAAAWPAGNTVASVESGAQALLQSIVEQDNEKGLNTRALLLVHRGRIVAEAYAQEADETTALLGWSMAKSMISVMLGNLEYRGLVDLDDKPGFRAWTDSQRSEILISDMLTMTDGLAFSEQYEPGDDATAMLFTEPSASSFALRQKAQHEPGTVFNYSSGTANMLARLHQDILGSPQQAYDDFMESIYRPMALQNAIFETDASGVFVGSSYLYASARDWARLGLLMLDQGMINGQRLVSADWVERATSPNGSNNEKAYGYQWWLNRGDERLRFIELPADAYFANGNRQQFVMVVPSEEAIIVRLGWTAGAYPVNDNFGRILDSLAED